MHLVDTTVISELMRPRPHSGVTAWVSAQRRIALSVVTIEEVSFGLQIRASVRMSRWFDRLVEESDVLPVTEAVARRCATLRAMLRARGRTRTQADMLIAATGAEHGAIVVTRNIRDFEGCGLRLIDPFAA